MAKKTKRPYLYLKSLTKCDIPAPKEHPWEGSADSTPTLSQFIIDLFAEVKSEDFEAEFTNKGTIDCGNVQITPFASEDGSAPGAPTTIEIKVDQRVKKTKKGNWVARRSLHREADIKLAELENLIFHDHSRNEAKYTPDIYDTNELLRWSHEDLQEAAEEMIDIIDMSLFQMFHKMPGNVGSMTLLQDRVFHVLVISAQSTLHSDASFDKSKSFVIQLPVDFESFSDVGPVMEKSHIKKKGSSWYYDFPTNASSSSLPATELQMKRQGNKLTEGLYVSLERILGAPKTAPNAENTPVDAPPVDPNDNHHVWDMMTLSTAKGFTLSLPDKFLENKTLTAITKDVRCAIEEIVRQRQRNGESGAVV